MELPRPPRVSHYPHHPASPLRCRPWRCVSARHHRPDDWVRHLLTLFLIFSASSIHFCSGVFQCDFDDPGICGFGQDTRDDLNFLHFSGRTPTEGTGPIGDHTSGEGHYMYMEATGAEYGSTARLISPRFNGSTAAASAELNGVEVTFWVHMNGEEMGSLRVLVMNATALPEDTDATAAETTTTTTTMQQVSVVAGVQGTDWVQKTATIQRPSMDFHIVFEASCGASVASDIAIDDVTVNDNVVFVPTVLPPIQLINCTFEDGLGVFTQDGDFSLIVTQAGANPATSDTTTSYAMATDHTLGTGDGHYLSVDAYSTSRWGWRRTSSGQGVGETARLTSPMVAAVAEGETPACLLFWYHMHGGEDVGSLAVYVKNETSDQLETPVWYLSGERGSVWRAAEIRIDSTLNFQIVFEFVSGSRENLAIDDVILARYECPGEHPVALQPSVSCDFGEVEICFYTHDPTGSFQWSWTNRATDSYFTGPAQDHTRGDDLGFYVHIDSLTQRPGSKARLLTPVIDPPRRPSCVEFWYHMYGSHIGQLNVYVRHNDSALPDTPSWSIMGNQGDVWHRGSFLVPNNMTRLYVIVFEGVLGRDYRTDIALDDVQYYPTSPCPSYPTAPPVPTTMPSGLPATFSCTFEADSCNFTQATDDVTDWRRVRPDFIQEDLNGYRYTRLRQGYTDNAPNWGSLRGPDADHTLGTHEGTMMAVWFKRDRTLRRDDRVRIISPLLAPSTGPRCLFFYVYKTGYTNDFLNIFLSTYGETRSIDPLWAYFWRTGWWWPRVVNIDPQDKPFNLIFEAVFPEMTTRYRRFMLWAIDDVSVENGRCPGNDGLVASCDFEKDDCGYWGRGWTRISGETPSRYTGPTADHTLGTANGHYMYYETSQPVRPKDTSNLYSPRMHFFGKQCLRFYYHMGGNDTRRLEMYLREPAQYIFTLLKKIEGVQQNAWMPANVDLDISGDFQIVFRAYAGRGYQGDIGIDDVIVLPHPCLDLPTETSCDFELGPDECNFQNARQNGIDWQWYDAIFGKNYPLVSNSTATNSFMYLAPKPTSPKDQPAELYSRHLTFSPSAAGDLCLGLEYIVQGTGPQTITASVEEKGGKRRELGTWSDKNMTEWRLVTWSLLSSHSVRPFIVYQIVLTASSPNDLAVVGIDNVVVSTAACQTLGTTGFEAQKMSSSYKGKTNSGMAAGLTIFVLVIIAIVVVTCFVFRSRIHSAMHRCSQSVTELNYKRHDVGFVNDEKKETVEIPAIITPGLGPGCDTAPPTLPVVSNDRNI